MKEKNIHILVCKYLDWKYPNVIYTSDASGMKLTIGLRNECKAKRCKKYKIPDLLILHPCNGYHGLAIEIKASVKDVFKRNGSLKSSSHLLLQSATITKLQELGYCASFGAGYEHCVQIIDNYFNDVK